jgi:hypothetical protein
MPFKYVKPERIVLLNHPEFNEAWVRDRIADDPALLGFGDIVLKDKERVQPHAGRLDLLCQSADSNRRFEIEIQLGNSPAAWRVSGSHLGYRFSSSGIVGVATDR